MRILSIPPNMYSLEAELEDIDVISHITGAKLTGAVVAPLKASQGSGGFLSALADWSSTLGW